ncbi:MAG: diguanylate cyclase [Solirubrobacteraceae bacterium]|nr:diguanylate cyclase [Solirubrobacteraceae bacterium]
MAAPTLLELDDVERGRILDFARRLRGVRHQALLVLFVVVGLGIQAYGALIVPPAAALVAGFWVLGRVLPRVHRVELPLMAMLVFAQASIVTTLAVADRWQLDGLGLLVLPATAACILLPRRLMALWLVWSVLVMVGAAFAIDARQVMDVPPILLLPVGVMLSVALPAATIRRLESESRDTALVDSLTGALNRGALEARIAELALQAHTMPLRLGVIMSDLDHFKGVNDDLGHDAGDGVLRETVLRMRSVLGPLTPVYRVGGEEFAVLIAGADEVGVQVVAERMREAVAAEPIGGRRVTMSFGIAAATLDRHPVGRIIEVADEALYRAKRAGRNRVATANLTPMSVLPDVASTDDGPETSDGAGMARRGGPADEAVAPRGAAAASPTPTKVPRPSVALGHDHGNWLVRGEFERDHIRESAHALSRTHHGALGFVFIALLACIPWIGWILMVPAVPAVIAYHAAERRVMALRRPEYMLGGTWLLVQLAIFCGALVADPAEPYMLVLFAPMMIGMTAVFPTRGVQVLSSVTVVLCVLAGGLARPDVLTTYPTVVGPPLLVVIGLALMSSVTGRSAIEFRTRAVVDPLTGLLTRAALRTRLAEVEHESHAATSSISVIVFDLDHFKALNDEHGHAGGDAALRAVGAATRCNLQALEWGFRLGGDEFMVVVPVGSGAAAALAERIRVSLEQVTVDGVTLTASFGIAAAAPDEPFDFVTVSRRADSALYEAKRAGRNRVAVATPVAAGPAPIATVLRDIA